MSNEFTQTQEAKDALDELIDHTIKSMVECSPMKMSYEERMMLDLESRSRSRPRSMKKNERSKPNITSVTFDP